MRSPRTAFRRLVLTLAFAPALAAAGCDGGADQGPGGDPAGDGGDGARDGGGGDDPSPDDVLRSAPTLASSPGFRLRSARLVGASDVILGPGAAATLVEVEPIPAGQVLSSPRFKVRTATVTAGEADR